MPTEGCRGAGESDDLVTAIKLLARLDQGRPLPTDCQGLTD